MKILIVDDEIDSLHEIEAFVREYGGFSSCVCCSNALEALEQANKITFDIALLDIEMPVMNGLELAEKLSAIFPYIGIAFLTAYNHYAAEAFEVNALDYVLKPIRQERLFRALDKLTKKKLDKHIVKDHTDGISIRMFGKFTVWADNEIIKWNRQKSLEIFAYLVENKEYPIHKETLCELFWYDLEPQKALINLQTAIHSIRKTLGVHDMGKVRIDYSVNKYILHIKDVSIDVNVFENFLQKAVEFKKIEYLKQAENIYTSEYLEEEGWLWAEPKKVMIQNQYIEALKYIKQMK